jgi:hypothetical protein
MARSVGFKVEAMCISPESPYSQQYTTEKIKCEAWEDGWLGAVDAPGNSDAYDMDAFYEWAEGGVMEDRGKCHCASDQGGPCSYCMEAKYNL